MLDISHWSIAGLQCAPEHEGHDNVVTNILWVVVVSKDGKSAFASGSVAVKYNPGDEFVEYQSLTENQVRGWIPPEFIQEVEEGIRSKIPTIISDDESPSFVTPQLPWLS